MLAVTIITRTSVQFQINYKPSLLNLEEKKHHRIEITHVHSLIRTSVVITLSQPWFLQFIRLSRPGHAGSGPHVCAEFPVL